MGEELLTNAWRALRNERYMRLVVSDWAVIRAYERGEPVPEAWAAYRQALRDLPAVLTDEEVLAWYQGQGEIPWPTPPQAP